VSQVSTPDGYGEVLRTQSTRGMTSYLVKGAGFEGWYDGLQVTSDFADQPDDLIPNDDNETVLPYPSRAQGPGWDNTNSTIQPDIDPHLEMGGASDSLTGEPTDEDPVHADIEGLFEPPSRLAHVRHRVHFAASDDPILDVSTIPDDSPTGLQNSPINPDGVSTDDLFNDAPLPNLEHQAATHDRLVIEDGLSFLKYADDDDDKKKKHHREQDGQSGFPRNNDDDSDDDDDDSDDSSSSDGGSDGGDSGGDGGGGHTASVVFALTTTADLHFLANVCHCAETLPLHSKSEHRELLAEAATDVDGVTPQVQDLDKLLERYQQDDFNYQESNLPNLVDRSKDDGDGGELLNHYASTKTAAPAADPGPTQIESQIEQLMQFWAVDNNGWWHWTGSQSDLALLNQMQQQMMAVGMPGGPPGQMQAQSAIKYSSFGVEENTPAPWRQYLQTIASDRLVALAAWKDVVDKSKRLRTEGAIDLEVYKPEVITAYIQGDNGRYYTTVQRLGSVPGAGRQLTSTQVSGWSCDCDWGHWAWIRKRSFVGRMCSHAYALFSEMRSLDAKARRGKGKPLSAGKFANASSKTSWARTAAGGFEWVSSSVAVPTAMISKTASGWNAQIWSDGTAEDSLDLGHFSHSEQARRAISRVVLGHLKVADEGDVDMVGGPFKPYSAPDSISGGGDNDPYSEDGSPEPEVVQDGDQDGSAGVQESTTRVGSYTYASLFAVAEHDDGQDDEGPEAEDDGIEEGDPDDDDEESLDEEIAEDEGDPDDGSDDEDDGEPEPDTTDDDGGHDEPHRRDDEDEDEGTDNPGDESDDDGIEKTSSVTELQEKFGLSHLAGANYSLVEQDRLIREGDGKTARNRGDLNLAGTHYEAASGQSTESEDVLAFLF
jgi:hypothetical protein